MNDRFLFNAVVSSYYDIDTPEHYEEFEPQIYLENVDLFSDEIGIDYDRLLEAVQNQLKLEKPEISQIMKHFEDNSNSNSEEYVTIKPDKILQCTGLKDKNDKLIYEGDIVEFNSDFNGRIRGIVYFDEMGLQIKTKLFYSSNFSQPYADRDLKYFSDKYFIKVIGSKYENPELLKECE